MPADAVTNPISCIQPPSEVDHIKTIIEEIKVRLAGFAIGLIVAGAVVAVGLIVFIIHRKRLAEKKQNRVNTIG